MTTHRHRARAPVKVTNKRIEFHGRVSQYTMDGPQEWLAQESPPWPPVKVIIDHDGALEGELELHFEKNDASWLVQSAINGEKLRIVVEPVNEMPKPSGRRKRK